MTMLGDDAITEIAIVHAKAHRRAARNRTSRAYVEQGLCGAVVCVNPDWEPDGWHICDLPTGHGGSCRCDIDGEEFEKWPVCRRCDDGGWVDAPCGEAMLCECQGARHEG